MGCGHPVIRNSRVHSSTNPGFFRGFPGRNASGPQHPALPPVFRAIAQQAPPLPAREAEELVASAASAALHLFVSPRG